MCCNFQTIWGSYWKDGKWGFKCCHSFVKESYCTGAAGQDAAKTNIIGLTPGALTAGDSTAGEQTASEPAVSDAAGSLPTVRHHFLSLQALLVEQQGAGDAG